MLFWNTEHAVNGPETAAGFREMKDKSLQAQTAGCLSQKRRRASCFDSVLSQRGSATVEAAAAIPVFLCAIAFLIILCQLLLTEGEIQHALSKTAAVCARAESVKEISGGEKGGGLSGSVNAASAFYSFLQGDSLFTSCIVGGRYGIIVSQKKSAGGGTVQVTASYILRVPLPFFGSMQTARRLEARRRMYTGFLVHGGEGGGSGGRGTAVYVTEHGSVYHTSLSCTHISLRISGSAQAVKMLEARGLRSCEKCMKSGKIPHSLYITAEGDCYHSTLGCSGLKRTVHTVHEHEIGGMELCERCAKRGGE